MLSTQTLKAGTTLYHGTDSDNLDEAEELLEGPAWLTDSIEVAQYFAQRPGGWGGTPRIVVYRLKEDVSLPQILTREDMMTLSEEHDIDTTGVEGMRESVQQSGLSGWIIPNNYPTGADILLADTSRLEFVESKDLPKNAPKTKPA